MSQRVGPWRTRGGVVAVLVAAAVCIGAVSRSGTVSASDPTTEALAALGHTEVRGPGSRPVPSQPEGSDQLRGIDHIVILMMENHTYDNLFGLLGRGDGLVLGQNGQPTATNPYPDGSIQHAFHMPTTCQLSARPSNEWSASHNAFDSGRNDGFVRTNISPAIPQMVGGVAMGYWTGRDLPFTYSLARAFPIGDRWFASTLDQTIPERRYLVAGTSAGNTDDFGTGAGNAVPDVGFAVPALTIFDELDLHGISWADYAQDYPLGATANVFPVTGGVPEAVQQKTFDQFFTDAAAGALPSVSLIDPNFGTESQENPQNIVLGDAMMSRVVHALGASRLWPHSLLVITYDEGGGYFDHVPPPVALAPDSIPPITQPGESSYDGFARYGFRVPSIVVSPYSKPRAVTHVLHDHTSILAMIERKWNLPALTYRDANANDLTDFLDMRALAGGRPRFPLLPPLASPGNTPSAFACSKTGPGVVPPPGSVTPPHH
jgi:phospholipase C